ncbi:hypothetical protein QUF74_00100 [Candidatus Halobeggiatoa sp. HSG11]|nr:hypothetical protein [Candidatus Halobeggiatoa sp. HSG11]
MNSLFECAYEIKKATGWSQEKIGAETGLAVSTISRIFRVPGYAGNETSSRLIQQLHEEVVGSPFPAYMEQLFKKYEYWKEQYTKKEFAEHLEVLESLLKNHRAIDSYELVACRVCWLLGHIFYDRAFYLRKGYKLEMSELALVWYRRALDILGHHEGLIVQRYKIQQCIVSTNFNLCDRNERLSSEAIYRCFVDMDYLQIVKTVIREDSWNWIAARNGLVAGSILQDWESCLLFWDTMQKVNKNFADLDFEPANELPAISQDSDLVWFVKQIKERS